MRTVIESENGTTTRAVLEIGPLRVVVVRGEARLTVWSYEADDWRSVPDLDPENTLVALVEFLRAHVER